MRWLVKGWKAPKAQPPGDGQDWLALTTAAATAWHAAQSGLQSQSLSLLACLLLMFHNAEHEKIHAHPLEEQGRILGTTNRSGYDRLQ